MSTLYRGGSVHAPGAPRATALLEDGGAVVWIGTDDAAPSAGRTVDLGGALLAPAFVDAHVHSTAAGLSLTGLDLTGVPSLAAALDRLERHARTIGGGFVLGTGWDDSRWPERRAPTSRELDRASYGGAVYLARTDVHAAVVSSALLAAVPEARELPGFGPDGFVTLEAHHALRKAALGAVTPGARGAAQRATRSRAAELGIACFHELSGPDIAGEADLAALLALAAAEPGPQVVGYWAALGDLGPVHRHNLPGGAGDLFVDGSLGAHTAALSTPYADGPGDGELRYDAEQVASHVETCTRAGRQAGFHAIGDRAVYTVLAGFRLAAERVGAAAVRAGRHRIEHVEMAGADAVAAIAAFGITASVQPAFDAVWGGPDGMYADRLGMDRAAGLNPYAALAAAGVPLALGSDAPVTPLDPWGGVRAAVHHRTPGSGLSARAAFTAATRGGWRAAGVDDAGVLAPGAPATFAVWAAGELRVQVPDERVAAWSTDPRAAVPGLPDLAGPTPDCLRTVLRGETIYDAGALA